MRFGHTDHAVARATQGRVNPKDDLISGADGSSRVREDGRNRTFPPAQARLHSLKLLRRDTHRSMVRTGGAVERKKEIQEILVLMPSIRFHGSGRVPTTKLRATAHCARGKQLCSGQL